MTMDPTVRADLERAVDGPLTVDITTTGRTSGEPQRIEIWMLSVDGRLVIGGTPGPRDWLANVRANPHLVVHLKDDVHADVAATAVEVTDPDERAAIWNAPATEWYRGQAPVAELIATSPTIVVTPD